MSEQELLELAAQAEQFSTHPIARSILTAWCGTPDRDRVAQVEELAGRGLRVQVDGKTVLAGNERLMTENGIVLPEQPGSSRHSNLSGVGGPIRRAAGHCRPA